MEHPDRNISKPLNTSLKRAGYDAEEEYFYRLNTELVDRNRRRLDEQRRSVETLEREKSHWMLCPKCGSQLKELEYFSVKADVCGGCSGVFLDKGELEQILEAHEPSGMRSLFKKWVSEITTPKPAGIHDFPV